MDVVIKELMTVTEAVFKKKHAELHDFEVLLEKLLEIDEVEIEERNRNSGTIHPSKLPNEYKSFARLEYIVKKWYRERNRGEEKKIIYIFGEEKEKNSSLDNRITSFPSRP